MEHKIRQSQSYTVTIEDLQHTKDRQNKDPSLISNSFGQIQNDTLEFMRRYVGWFWLLFFPTFGWKFAYNLPLSLSSILIGSPKSIFDKVFGDDWQNLFCAVAFDQKINITNLALHLSWE